MRIEICYNIVGHRPCVVRIEDYPARINEGDEFVMEDFEEVNHSLEEIKYLEDTILVFIERSSHHFALFNPLLLVPTITVSI